MKLPYFLLLFGFVACSVPKPPQTEQDRWQAQAATIEIIRDDFGVPHIYGKTDADAVFGLLYAQCEDDFNRVEQNYIWAIGRLAEVEGEEAIYSDLRARLFMTTEEAIDHYENSPEWLKKLCDAFADGINYYLYTHPEVKPKLLTRFEPWMPMFFSEGSIGGDIEQISTRKIKEFYDSINPIAANKIPVNVSGLADDEPRGSNGIAISGVLTESGNTMLLINPHTSFFFRGEVHVVSGEGLNVYGAVTWGQFFVYQGFNEKAGWMHTSVYTDRIDEFKETTVNTDEGMKYQYGDELRPVEELEVTLKYKDGGKVNEKTFPVYRTHHGPITQKAGNQWVATSMMWAPIDALIQSFTRTKQRDYKGFREMMDIRANSSNNTVYADADGNIAYFHGNFMPVKNIDVDYSNPVDGSDPSTDWQGLHTVDEMITLFNPPNGWIQNCNSTPYTSAAENSPKMGDYPHYMSINQENYRGVHAVKLLKEANALTLDKLIALGYDPYLPAFEAIIPGLVQAFDQHPDESLQVPIEVLRNWNYKVSEESIAMSLAHFYGINYLREGTIPDTLTGMERIVYIGKNSPEQERLAVLKKTVDQLTRDFGNWRTQWGEINRYQRITGDIRQNFNDSLPSIAVGLASGNWGALASFGARAYDTKRIYGTSGNSFVAVVEFGDKVKAKSLLAGGQSGDPTSPHFDDQAQRYADVKFKDVAYYREDVEKRAKAKYHPGKSNR